MLRALKIIESLNLTSIVCVFDQAIYSKAIEIKWKERGKFDSCVLMMGMFHMLMMFMHILSKRFSDAGLRDVLIQSGVIAEGSVDKALSGKMYNRGVRMYKIMYEAVMRRVLDSIPTTKEEDDWIEANLDIENLNFDTAWDSEIMRKKYNDFLDTREKLEAGEPLQQFWMSFLEMVELLLNTIYSIRAGDWELLLECIRNILPYTFAYDNINYARYASAMLGDMLQLPDDFPEIHNEFMKGNFAVHISDNTKFSRVETDKVIEMTLNKDTKTPGGCTGFSTNVNAVKRWEINAAYRAALRTCFHKHLDYHPQKFKHPDLNPSRIKKDEDAVQCILTTIATTFIEPLSPLPLLSISTGIMATDRVASDMSSAKTKGKAAFDEFTKTRLTSERSMCIFDPMKKLKLATFASMNKIKACKVNSKIIPVQASKELFAKISLVSQMRSLDMRSVFKFPLGPVPWSLAEPIGTLKKTSKASLIHKLEDKVEPLQNISGEHAMIFDGMAYVQQSQITNKTFGQLAMDLLIRILSAGARAARIDVVFDEYRDLSIKNVERSRRSRGQLLFKRILSTAEIKQWGLFLSSNENKNSLITFIVSEWKKPQYMLKIGRKHFYVTNGNSVCKINEEEICQVEQLHSNHEEADTRMLLHVQHASLEYPKVLIASPDTDVFVICLSVHLSISANLFFLTGVKNSRRIIDVTRVANHLFESLKNCDVSKELLMKSLVGFHSFTGCDTVSAFAGRGKIKPLKVMLTDPKYVQAFADLGGDITETTLKTIKSYVSHMYGWKEIDVNEVRYRMYCRSGGKIACEQLPPCTDVLELHIMRANYQARIWRETLVPHQHDVDPVENGWVLDDDGALAIKWMRCNPAPEEVIMCLTYTYVPLPISNFVN